MIGPLTNKQQPPPPSPSLPPFQNTQVLYTANCHLECSTYKPAERLNQLRSTLALLAKHQAGAGLDPGAAGINVTGSSSGLYTTEVDSIPPDTLPFLIPPTQVLYTANCHLEGSPYKPAERLNQLRSTLASLAKHQAGAGLDPGSCHVLIGGDMNSCAAEAPYKLLAQGWLPAGYR